MYEVRLHSVVVNICGGECVGVCVRVIVGWIGVCVGGYWVDGCVSGCGCR